MIILTTVWCHKSTGLHDQIVISYIVNVNMSKLRSMRAHPLIHKLKMANDDNKLLRSRYSLKRAILNEKGQGGHKKGKNPKKGNRAELREGGRTAL